MQSRPDPLAAALLTAQSDRRSGVFDVRAGDAHTFLYFAHGSLVFAEEDSLGESLGRLLVREGRLSSDQYAQAIRAMTSRLVDNEEIGFAEAAVQLGFLTGEQVQESLAALVRARVVRVFLSENQAWTFEEHERAPMGRFPTRVEPQVLAATRLFEQQRLGRTIELDRARYPHLVESADVLSQAFEMRPAEVRFILRVDGTRTTKDLVAGTGGGAEAVLAALVLAGRVELRDRPVEIQGAPKPAATSAPAPHRPALPRRTAPPLAAFVSKAADPKLAARQLADEAFKKAKTLLLNQDVSRALPELQKAAEVLGGSAEFQVFLLWAELPTLPEDGKKAKNAALKQAAVEAVRQNPTFAFGHFVMGQLAMADDPKAAARYFQHALHLDRNLVEAEQHLRLAKARERK